MSVARTQNGKDAYIPHSPKIIIWNYYRIWRIGYGGCTNERAT